MAPLGPSVGSGRRDGEGPGRAPGKERAVLRLQHRSRGWSVLRAAASKVVCILKTKGISSGGNSEVVCVSCV